jgi:SM-20-related protein
VRRSAAGDDFARRRNPVDIAADLTAAAVSVQDHFLAPAEISALTECAQLRRARGDFTAARIGIHASLQRREEIRGDSICWIVPPLLPAEDGLLQALEILRRRLNRDAWLGLFDLELHYAWYPAGARYERHVDQPRGRMQRQVSVLLYLNVGWTPAAGGELRIYDAAGGHRDIEPLAGRLVCFLAPGREHAVMTTHRDRLSISGWFRARDVT